jgi:hypothetical protein
MSGRHAESFFRSQPRSSVRARSFFFVGLPGRIRSAAGRAEIFFWPVQSLFTQLCQPVHLFLLGRLRAEMSARAAKFSFAVRSHRRCAAKIFWLSGRIRAAVCSCRNFFCRAVFFCRPVSSAQNLLFFLWRMESLQYTFSESCVRNLNCLAFSLCRFWLSDRTG